MASIIENIKVLRETTGAGMVDCKKALEANNNDIQLAVDWLREKGIMKAAKKASRIAAEGLTAIAVNGNDAAIVEVNSETDFVAKNQSFIDLVQSIADAVVKAKPASLELANKVALGNSTIESAIVEATARIGEKISFRRFEVVSKDANSAFGAYSHMGGKISVVTVIDGTNDETVAKDIAMHIAAFAPQYLTRNEIPADVVEKETHIQLEAAKTDPKLASKPEAVLAGIIKGKLSKQFAEVCLVDQPFAKDPSLTVAQYANTVKGTVKSFVRYNVGEGMQKREDNFAEEVMAQVK